MGFKVKCYDSQGHGWLSQPMTPIGDDQSWSREKSPYGYAENFVTRAEAQAEIEAMRLRFPNSLAFEIV
jgi:hypothetical protein